MNILAIATAFVVVTAAGVGAWGGELAAREMDKAKDIHQAAAQCGGIIEPTFRASGDAAIYMAQDYAKAHGCRTISWVY